MLGDDPLLAQFPSPCAGPFNHFETKAHLDEALRPETELVPGQYRGFRVSAKRAPAPDRGAF